MKATTYFLDTDQRHTIALLQTALRCSAAFIINSSLTIIMFLAHFASTLHFLAAPLLLYASAHAPTLCSEWTLQGCHTTDTANNAGCDSIRLLLMSAMFSPFQSLVLGGGEDYDHQLCEHCGKDQYS